MTVDAENGSDVGLGAVFVIGIRMEVETVIGSVCIAPLLGRLQDTSLHVRKRVIKLLKSLLHGRQYGDETGFVFA